MQPMLRPPVELGGKVQWHDLARKRLNEARIKGALSAKFPRGIWHKVVRDFPAPEQSLSSVFVSNVARAKDQCMAFKSFWSLPPTARPTALKILHRRKEQKALSLGTRPHHEKTSSCWSLEVVRRHVPATPDVFEEGEGSWEEEKVGARIFG